jgi:hypothetical protein
VTYEELSMETEGEAPPEESIAPGVVDVHSASTDKALDGTFYKDW